MTNLEKYIDNEVVTTSAEVVDYCVNVLHLTNEAARQRIRRLPNRKWSSICESHKGKTLEFEIWCTGGFSKESINRLDNAIAKTRKYKLSYFDADKMRQAAEDSNIPHFNEILKTYYIKEI
ncbi:MAG: hypothetical protein R3Y26_06375 [Rikenellaceae bacterium]